MSLLSQVSKSENNLSFVYTSAIQGFAAKELSKAGVEELEKDDLTIDTGLSSSMIAGENWVDLNGHGTHIAGTIGAKSNGSGVIGAAYGTTLVAVKVLGGTGGTGSDASTIAGCDYVYYNAIAGEVFNYSVEDIAPDIPLRPWTMLLSVWMTDATGLWRQATVMTIHFTIRHSALRPQGPGWLVI